MNTRNLQRLAVPGVLVMVLASTAPLSWADHDPPPEPKTWRHVLNTLYLEDSIKAPEDMIWVQSFTHDFGYGVERGFRIWNRPNAAANNRSWEEIHYTSGETQTTPAQGCLRCNHTTQTKTCNVGETRYGMFTGLTKTRWNRNCAGTLEQIAGTLTPGVSWAAFPECPVGKGLYAFTCTTNDELLAEVGPVRDGPCTASLSAEAEAGGQFFYTGTCDCIREGFVPISESEEFPGICQFQRTGDPAEVPDWTSGLTGRGVFSENEGENGPGPGGGDIGGVFPPPGGGGGGGGSGSPTETGSGDPLRGGEGGDPQGNPLGTGDNPLHVVVQQESGQVKQQTKEGVKDALDEWTGDPTAVAFPSEPSYDSTLEGVPETEDWTATITDWLSSNPIAQAISGSGLQISGASCSMSTVVYGQPFVIDFCPLEWALNLLGAFILAIASLYSIFIVFGEG